MSKISSAHSQLHQYKHNNSELQFYCLLALLVVIHNHITTKNLINRMQALSHHNSVAFPSPLSVRAQARPSSPHPCTPHLSDTGLMGVQRVVPRDPGASWGAWGHRSALPLEVSILLRPEYPFFVLRWIISNSYYFYYFLFLILVYFLAWPAGRGSLFCPSALLW